jgi:hypothetical protein
MQTTHKNQQIFGKMIENKTEFFLPCYMSSKNVLSYQGRYFNFYQNSDHVQNESKYEELDVKKTNGLYNPDHNSEYSTHLYGPHSVCDDSSSENLLIVNRPGGQSKIKI